MNMTTTPAFTDFQAGITEALAELDRLARYCADTLAVDPCGAAKTVEDLEHQIQEIADMIRGRMAIFKRAMRKAKHGTTETLSVNLSDIPWIPVDIAEAMAGKTIKVQIPEQLRARWGQSTTTPEPTA